MKIAFIGGGNMATAIISGMLKQSSLTSKDIAVIEINAAARARLAREYGVHTSAQPSANLRAQDAIVLAVKPQQLKEAAQALAPYLQQQLVISIAAGVRMHDISRWLGNYARIVRCMPNTPALIGMGVTGLAALPEVDTQQRKLADRILSAAGQTLWCSEEKQLDMITALSGSGPAYVFYFIEAMQEAACQFGLPGEQARQLAIATFTGAAQLAAHSNEPVSTLCERVTSKGGTTAAALAVFEQDHLKAAILRGIQAARARAESLGDELGAQ
jgi:pyrroline-5-carboxylate reductase